MWRVERGALDAREKQERTDSAVAKARARGRCEVTLGGFRCARPDCDTHHVIKRSQGGKFKGPDYLMRVCRTCHSLMDAAPEQATRLHGGAVIKGRLRVVALGGGAFNGWMETHPRRVALTRVGDTTERTVFPVKRSTEGR